MKTFRRLRRPSFRMTGFVLATQSMKAKSTANNLSKSKMALRAVKNGILFTRGASAKSGLWKKLQSPLIL